MISNSLYLTNKHTVITMCQVLFWVFYEFSQLNQLPTLRNRNYHYPHFTDEETKVWRGLRNVLEVKEPGKGQARDRSDSLAPESILSPLSLMPLPLPHATALRSILSVCC